MHVIVNPMNTFIPINRFPDQGKRVEEVIVHPEELKSVELNASKLRKIERNEFFVGGDSRINDLMNDTLIKGKFSVFGISLSKM